MKRRSSSVLDVPLADSIQPAKDLCHDELYRPDPRWAEAQEQARETLRLDEEGSFDDES